MDVDFPAVFRAEAGLDSIAQAAGRCNREGRLTDDAGNPRLGRVVVFDYDSKTYPTVTLIARAAESFREVAPDHLADLLAPDAIEAYFRLHYWQQGGDDGRAGTAAPKARASSIASTPTRRSSSTPSSAPPRRPIGSSTTPRRPCSSPTATGATT